MQFEQLPKHIQISINAVGGPETEAGRDMWDLLTRRGNLGDAPATIVAEEPKKIAAPVSPEKPAAPVASPVNEDADPVLDILSSAAQKL